MGACHQSLAFGGLWGSLLSSRSYRYCSVIESSTDLGYNRDLKSQKARSLTSLCDDLPFALTRAHIKPRTDSCWLGTAILPTPTLSTRTRPQTRNLIRHRPAIINSIRPHNHLIAFPRSFLCYQSSYESMGSRIIFWQQEYTKIYFCSCERSGVWSDIGTLEFSFSVS